MMAKSQINCFDCQFLIITWDKKMPYGCKRLGFKSRRLPSHEVLKSSNIKCQFFIKKVRDGK